MLKVSEIVRGGGTPFGSYSVDGGAPVGAVEAETAARSGYKVAPADVDTLETICAWHRQNERGERANELELALPKLRPVAEEAAKAVEKAIEKPVRKPKADAPVAEPKL
jgi:hypothetical protein